MAYTLALSSSTEGLDSNIWAPPSSPHAQDDEFEGSDLSSWGVYNITDGAAGSFSYNTVDAYDTSFNAGNAVRVNMSTSERPSWALIQAPASGKRFMIYKSFSFPTNLLMFARMKFSINWGLTTNDRSISLNFCTASAGVPLLHSRVVGFLNKSTTGAVASAEKWASGAGAASGVRSLSTTGSEGQAMEIVAIHKRNTDYDVWIGTGTGNFMWVESYGSLGFTPDMIGFEIWNNAVSAPGTGVVGIDFIRFIETANFLL